MVRVEKEARILEMKGQATEDETAKALGVAVSTVRRVWGTEEPATKMEDAPQKAELRERWPHTYTDLIMSEYIRLIVTLDHQQTSYERKAKEDPENPEWPRLALRAEEAEISILDSLAGIIGLGTVMYMGEDGYTYSDENIARYFDRGEPPKVRKDRIAKEALEDLDMEAMFETLGLGKEKRAEILAKVIADAGS